MGNAHILVPHVLTFSDWVDVGIKMENFMKMDEGIKAEDPIAALRQFLNGGDDLANVPHI
jgi:hypothetical protein